MPTPGRKSATASDRLVWLSAWEWECCGAPFHIGEHVEWAAEALDRTWLVSVLGTDLGVAVTDAETHHAGEATPLAGEVTRIRAVFAREGTTTTFAEREAGDAAEYSTAQARAQDFAGYLVDLRV